VSKSTKGIISYISTTVIIAIIAIASIVPLVNNASVSKCVASQMPAAPQPQQVVNAETGLLPKSANIDDYVYPAGIVQTGTNIGDETFGDFLKSCGTRYTIKDTVIKIDQQKYNYIIREAGLNANFRNGVYLTDAAAKSLGINTFHQIGSHPGDGVMLEYVLIPTK